MNNDLIKEVAKQATIVRKTFHGVEHIEFDKEKFAESACQEVKTTIAQKFGITV